MRVFVRLPNGLVPTFDLPDNSMVKELKDMIVLSGQLRAERGMEQVRLLARDVEMENNRKLQTYTPEDCERRYLHVLLRDTAAVVRPASVEACIPAPGCSDSPLDARVVYTPLATSAAKWSLEVCATKGCVLAGSSTVDVLEGEAQLQWSPSNGLLADTVHTVYATNADDNEECSWCFRTAKLEAIRLLVTDGDPDDARLVSIDRTSALIAELHSRVLSRFDLSSEEVQIADLILTREHVSTKVQTDMDVAGLQEFDVLWFRIEPVRQIEPDPTALTTRAEYLEAHWVNDSAGFYALCGKMSAEEENIRLLEIVQAFDVTGSSDSSAAVDIAEAPEDADGSAKSPSAAACGCGLADDPTLTVVPADLVRPLWGLVGSGCANSSLLLQEDALATASARWLSSDMLDGFLHQQAETLVTQLQERGFAVVQLGASTMAEHGSLMASTGENTNPQPAVWQQINHRVLVAWKLQQSTSLQRNLRTARLLAPTPASSTQAMFTVRHSRRSCSKFEQVDQLLLVFGRAVASYSETQPCGASELWVDWLRKCFSLHAVSISVFRDYLSQPYFGWVHA